MLSRMLQHCMHARPAAAHRILSPLFLRQSTAKITSVKGSTTASTTASITAPTKPVSDPKLDILGLLSTEDPLITAFVNNIMKHGKKSTARRIAMEKVEPLIKVVGSKRGSKSIQVPRPLNERQRRRIAILWIIQEANKRHKKSSMGERIGMEVLSVLQGDSAALTKRSQMHKAALQNRSNIVLMDRKVMRF
ncbi:ribosomal protein S7 domain-containing protein [Chytridium lagenaria]|nr:ribosomal protein S7 domain-containing protein [Chytridium lagenaria]